MLDIRSTRSPTTVDGSDAVLTSALDALLRAFNFARDVEADLWSFAVEITSLRKRGIDETLLRWLAARGYVEHRLETTLPGDENRGFRSTGLYGLVDSSCFVLTTAGADFAAMTFANQSHGAAKDTAQGNGVPDPHDDGSRRSTAYASTQAPGTNGSEGGSPDCEPLWDPLRRELKVGQCVVKRFKLPSANQETLLTAFEEEGWPARIDDPLPPRLNHDSKMRLHNAIKGLNRHQKQRLIRFMGDGTGEGILWELILPEG